MVTEIHEEKTETWKEIKEQLITASETNNGHLTFYTNSSLIDNKSNLADLIMGAAWYNTDTKLTMGFKVWAMPIQPTQKLRPSP